METMWSLLSIYLDTLSPFVVLIFVLFKRKSSIKGDFVFWFIVIQFLLNLVAIYLSRWFGGLNNLFVYHINAIASIGVLSFFFSNILGFKYTKPIIIYTLILVVVFDLINTIWLEGLGMFNSITYSLISIIIVIYCLLYYLSSLLWARSINIAKSREFWHVTGLFTYYSTSFFIFISYRYLTENAVANMGILWKIHNVVFMVMCIYFFIGYICKSSRKNYKLS